MTVDIGPFQEITGVSFPIPDTPEEFTSGEGIKGRFDTDKTCDEDSEYSMGGGVLVTDPDSTSCGCPSSSFSAGVDGFTLRISFPLTEDWPSCIIGASSGAKISKDWPGEPDDWGTGSPEPFTSPQTCDLSVFVSGQQFGGSYRVTFFYVEDCTPPGGDPDCCG